MDIVDLSKKTDIKYHHFMVGGKGECTNFGLLGRCMETCPCKHVTSTVLDDSQCSIKEALEQGLAIVLTLQPGIKAGWPGSVTPTLTTS
jgi:hypothetical protein